MTQALCAAELLAFEGPDALAFAHGQFCNDVLSMKNDAWQWNAWLDSQGRVQAFFALLRVRERDLLAWLPLGDALALREALVRYVMRAKVRIEPRTWTLHALDPDVIEGAIEEHAVRAHGDGFAFAQPPARSRIAWLAPSAIAEYDTEALRQWRLADIAAGLPLLAPGIERQFVAQALDLERLDAIRFDKGCYPGQEIVARLHFRGGNKRHLQRIRIDASAVAPGTKILDTQGRSAGTVLYAADTAHAASDALAVLTQTHESSVLVLDNGANVRLCT